MNLPLDEFIQKTISLFEAEKGIKKMWRQPLVAALSAINPLFSKLKETAADDHFLPEDILPGAKSIVVFFIPFETGIIRSNIKGEAASAEWARAYILTNELIVYINEVIENEMNQNGYRVGKLAPTHNFDEKTLISRWSHRHIAWMAGLGTFGINNMLITKRGCCGRLGSFVTDAESRELGLSEESLGVPLAEKCLFKINGSCGVCQKKCPVKAYEESGNFNRHACYKVCLKNAALYKETIGFADVCGKCLVGLPCSSKEPYIQ